MQCQMLVYLASVWILTCRRGRRLQEGLALGLGKVKSSFGSACPWMVTVMVTHTAVG